MHVIVVLNPEYAAVEKVSSSTKKIKGYLFTTIIFVISSSPTSKPQESARTFVVPRMGERLTLHFPSFFYAWLATMFERKVAIQRESW